MRLPEPDRVEQPNMTPMIDIVFQLLIFFVLSMNFPDAEGALRLQMPRRGVAPSAGPPVEEIRLTIRTGPGRACDVKVDRAPAGTWRPGRDEENRRVAAAAAARAAEIREAAPGAPLVVDADGGAPYEVVVAVVDALAARKLGGVEFAADPRSAGVTGR